jgi:hypothetical protein
VYVESTGQMHGPELPDMEGGWPSMTVAWWRTWRRAPQASTFTETDWQFLLETALLHAAFVSGRSQLAGELRLRVAKFGATPEDRLRLRMAVGKPPEAGNAPPAAKPGEQGGRRDRILSLVEDAG